MTGIEATGTDDFMALGLIALSYGVALLLHTYGFLAVFAAGAAIRRIERRQSEGSMETGETSERKILGRRPAIRSRRPPG